jgi:hypothetical protein
MNRRLAGPQSRSATLEEMFSAPSAIELRSLGLAARRYTDRPILFAVGPRITLVRIPVGTTVLSLLHSGAHSASYPKGTGAVPPVREAHHSPFKLWRDEDWWSHTSTPQHVFTAQCLINWAQEELYHTAHILCGVACSLLLRVATIECKYLKFPIQNVSKLGGRDILIFVGKYILDYVQDRLTNHTCRRPD